MEAEFFGAPYARFADVYDRLMRDVDYDAWAEYLDGLMKEHGGVRSVLDCACGTGAFSLRLLDKGYRVTGIDVSADMLRVAEENARRAGAALPFVLQDMREIRLHRPVDAIIAACDGVNYLTRDKDLHAFFMAAHGALRPGGLILFDVSTIDKFACVLDGAMFGEAEEDCAYLWRSRYDDVSRLCEMELTCFEKRGMLYARFDERHVQRGYTEEELTRALGAAGFQHIRVYGTKTRVYPEKGCERVQYAAVRA